MKLGYHTGYWSAGPPAGVPEAIARCERLGFDSIWAAEAYGSDCLTPLAWWGASTERIRLGTNIMQISARTPAAAAMAAMTLDHLSGGRFILGLGASGPQVVEGWYGQPYPKPLARTREYVEVIRRILARDVPVTHAGEFYPLPYPGGANLGKPLKSTVHPLRSDIPIMLGAEGPKNVALSAEIADGWLPMFFSPKMDGFYREALAEGFARPGARRTAADFEVPAFIPMVVHDDVEEAANLVRPSIALYIGGMGAKSMNFHANHFARLGYEAEVAEIQELFLSGRKLEAMGAVPTKLVEDIALVGPAAKIRDELQLWNSTVITSLIVQSPPEQVGAVADILS
ncbi:MAG: LLM class F420-dependent oxidoreductase [Jatrophihabitans sp.]|uniref:LLM class F420-dependent oxidoreductase n=1 Tax=Jatrophihabitans sp. TaxID=1932789 RepID=UPI00390D94F5